MQDQGHLAIVLHAHLPYVRHPEHESFLEEDWFFEAVVESYIPLLSAFESMARDGVPFRATVALSPPLLSMLGDELLRERTRKYLERLRALVEQELQRNQGHGHLRYLGEHYRERVERAIATWDRLDGDLAAGFAALERSGHLDLLTCAATHGYLPLLSVDEEAVRAQILVGVEHHQQVIGRAPTGIWLPECGFYPGLDAILAEAGLRYFVVDTHSLLLASPRPRHGGYAPVFCQGTGVVAFARDIETTAQVWSRERGYPGDPLYREFYRDIGYDLDLGYIGPWVQPTGARKNTGIKYHRITGRTDEKQLYDPYWAREKAAEHAAHFMWCRERQIEHLHGHGSAAVVVAPYDAELFGHWWYEGPEWLEFVFRKCVYDQRVFRLTHLAEYVREHPTLAVTSPAPSSWGDRGFNEYWLNTTNEWIYPHLHRAAARMISLASGPAGGAERGSLGGRALAQAARELLLAQASDWAFIMRTGTAVEYAAGRTRSHLRRFFHLDGMIRGGAIDEPWLARIEQVDSIFPRLDPRVYRRKSTVGS
jgi:1,4-alpha-glucan branching enzyme